MTDKLKIVLIDDERDSREVMARLLASKIPEAVIVGEASSAEEGYALIVETAPDLVLLDIQMPKENGFSLLKRFGESIPFEVIFVTSFDQYAINAIKFSALDYLLKPVDTTELRFAILKAIKIIEGKQNSNLQLINLIDNLSGPSGNRKIAVHSGHKVRFLSESTIVYIEANGRYCNIHTAGKTEFTVSRHMKDFEDYFESKTNFIRINKNTMINTDYIRTYSKGEPCIIEMDDDLHFEVSRRKKQEILGMLKNLL